MLINGTDTLVVRLRSECFIHMIILEEGPGRPLGFIDELTHVSDSTQIRLKLKVTLSGAGGSNPEYGCTRRFGLIELFGEATRYDGHSSIIPYRSVASQHGQITPNESRHRADIHTMVVIIIQSDS